MFLFNTIYNNIGEIITDLANCLSCDVFYDERVVWIQAVNSNVAKVGFVDNFEEKDVPIQYLYEKNVSF